MQELRRQSYLAALGIDSYFPRWQLANAPLAVQCEWPAERLLAEDPVPDLSSGHEVLSGEAPISVAKTGAQSGSLVMDDVLEGLRGKNPAIAAKKETPLQPANSAEPSAVAPRFSLSIWRAVDDWLILDSRDPEAALPVFALLGNILKAVWHTSPAALDEEVWHWPITDSAAAAHTAEDARVALSVWLEVEMEKRAATHILLMGANAFQYLAVSANSYEQSPWQIRQEGQRQLVITPSLTDMLRNPLDKKKLWNLLSSLS